METGKKVIVWLTSLAGVYGLIFEFFLGQCLGFYPFYKVYRVPIKSVQLNMYHFPGERLRPTAEFQTTVSQSEIERVSWELDTKTGTILNESGLAPTVTLPPGGGLYELRVSARIRGEATDRTGVTSIYVVQD